MESEAYQGKGKNCILLLECYRKNTWSYFFLYKGGTALETDLLKQNEYLCVILGSKLLVIW